MPQLSVAAGEAEGAKEGRRRATTSELGEGGQVPERERQGRASPFSSCSPPRKYEKNFKKFFLFFSLFSSSALHLYPPPHTQERAHKNKGGGWGDKATSPGASIPHGLGAGVSGAGHLATSEREGKGMGFLSAPLPRSSLLQSRAAASLTPYAPGPRDSHHLPPAPAPSAARPGGRRSPVTGSPPPQLCKAPGANEECGPGKSRVLACKLYCNSSALFRRRQQNKV